jgi:hypothetical protein
MSRGKGRPHGERNRQAIAGAAIRQEKILARTPHRRRRKQIWDRRTRAHDVAESNTTIAPCREVARPIALHVVTGDADGPNPMMQPIECRALELLQTCWYEPAQHSQHAIESVIKSDIQTVRDQVPTTEMARIPDELVEDKPITPLTL